ncbi:MAG: glutathione S-transferase [Gammaproteobacteria bacterium]|jgi:GST-like protein|nr:glutathione S-transferase [Gammaproteobacteria bacterium]MDP6164698.1 glutathione S-transferase N-terminal domain-containing protein [Gammaproteobacteria bacterium]
MIDLHYWPTPNGWKITILLAELDVPYQLKYVNIMQGDQFAPAFLTIAPNNRIPAIVDHHPVDGGKPISLFESGAIMQYLGDKYGQFYSQDLRTRQQINQWLFWQMGGLGPMAGQAHHFRQYAPQTIAYGVDRYTKECNRLYGVMNRHLAEREYLAGEYSIADMACWPWAMLNERQGQDINDFPHVKRWIDAIEARPAVRQGQQIGLDLRRDITDEESRNILFGQTASSQEQPKPQDH